MDGIQANLPGISDPRGQRRLAEIKDPEIEIAAFGKRAPPELQLFCHMVNGPDAVSGWRGFYAWLRHIISQNHDRLDDAVKLVRRLQREIDFLPGISGMNKAWHRHTNFSAADAIQRWYHLRQRGPGFGWGLL